MITTGSSLRVVMVTPNSPEDQGGVERHVREVATRVNAMGHDVSVLWADSSGRRAGDVNLGGVALTGIKAWPRGRDWLFAPGLGAAIRRSMPDVIHVQSYHTLVAPLAMTAALRAGLPYVVTFHGGGHSSQWRNRARVAQRQALRPLLARADRLVAVAEFERDDYGRELRVPTSRFAVIPNGTDVAAFSQVPPARGANVVDPVIATVGRLEEYKGHHRVIGAFPVLLESVPGARLVIVGTGPYEQALRDMARSLGIDGRVTFTSTPAGDSAALAELLSKVDLVVLLSEFETHPLAALEAAAAKRRLLVSDRGGMREIAAHGLARSIPFGSGSAEIADAMKQALAAPAPVDEFQIPTWDDCAEQLVALYMSVSRR